MPRAEHRPSLRLAIRLAFLLAFGAAGFLLLPQPSNAGGRPPATGSMVRTWVVRPGDSASSIARRFHMSERDLHRLNPELPDRLTPGQSLYVQLPMAVGTRVGSRSVRHTAPRAERSADAGEAPIGGGYSTHGQASYGRAGGFALHRPGHEAYAGGGYADAGGEPSTLHAPAGRAPGAPVRPRWDGAVRHFPAGAPTVAFGLRGVAEGRPQDGQLVDPVRLPDVPGIHIRRPERAYGTGRLVQILLRAVAAVERRYPESQVIAVGDLSAPHGGPLPGHKSHQNGRDADIAYYTLDESTDDRFVDVTPKTLDVVRTWTLIEALLDSGDIQFLFIDHALQAPLYEHAKDHASPRWRTPDALARVFQYPMPEWAGVGIIRHEPNHTDHIHVRIDAPDATEDVAAR